MRSTRTLATRRATLGGLGAVGLLCAAPMAAASGGARVFELYRGKAKIGRQSMTVRRDGSDVQVAVDIEINAKLLGMSVYKYRLSSREVWRNGALMALRSEGNDGGTPTSVNATREGGSVTIRGSANSGSLSGSFATTTYWSPEFLKRSKWLSTQDGTVVNISARKGGTVQVPTPEGQTAATRWMIRGDIGVLDLFYDANGEWVGNSFEARGETARFVLTSRGGNFANLL